MDQASEEPEDTPRGPLHAGGPSWIGAPGSRPHLHALLLVLHAVQLVVLVTVLVLAVLQEGDLLQHRAAQALFAVLAGRIPAQDRGAEGLSVLPDDKARLGVRGGWGAGA